MKSHEVIRNAVEESGVKAVAASLKISSALVYKWCEPPAEQDDPDASGAKNPLDRVREMYLLTKDIRLIRWLCNAAGGFFVADPVPDIRKNPDETIVEETRRMMRDFSELLEAVTGSMQDGKITSEEAGGIRERWEDLKACAEQFVLSSEKGLFRGK